MGSLDQWFANVADNRITRDILENMNSQVSGTVGTEGGQEPKL